MLGHVSLLAPHGCRVESQTAAVLASRRCVCPVGQLEDRRLVPTEPPRAAEPTARDPETGRFRWAAAASLLPTPGTGLECVKQLYAGTGSGRRAISWTSKMVVLKPPWRRFSARRTSEAELR